MKESENLATWAGSSEAKCVRISLRSCKRTHKTRLRPHNPPLGRLLEHFKTLATHQTACLDLDLHRASDLIFFFSFFFYRKFLALLDLTQRGRPAALRPAYVNFIAIPSFRALCLWPLSRRMESLWTSKHRKNFDLMYQNCWLIWGSNEPVMQKTYFTVKILYRICFCSQANCLTTYIKWTLIL